MSIFKKILEFFAKFFNEAKKAYERLPEAEKLALQNGTGIVALFNSMLQNTPQEIRIAIHQKFPNLDEAKLETALFDIADTLGLPHMGSIEKMIDLLRDKLSWALAHADETKHDKISHVIAEGLALGLSSKEAKVGILVSLIEYAFRRFIQKTVK